MLVICNSEVAVKNATYWDVAPCGSNSSPRLHYFFYPEDGGDAFLLISVHNKLTWRHSPEDGIPLNRHRKNLKSYISVMFLRTYGMLQSPLSLLMHWHFPVY
jgi:hypothetical protein